MRPSLPIYGYFLSSSEHGEFEKLQISRIKRHIRIFISAHHIHAEVILTKDNSQVNLRMRATLLNEKKWKIYIYICKNSERKQFKFIFPVYVSYSSFAPFFAYGNWWCKFWRACILAQTYSQIPPSLFDLMMRKQEVGVNILILHILHWISFSANWIYIKKFIFCSVY